MRALSILQPWAWLIANGHKDIENRHWKTHWRGRFLIHAGKKWGGEQCDDLESVRESFPHITFPERFDLGGVVGAATIVDCVAFSSSPWFVGSWGFVLQQARTCSLVPWRGQLGWFDIPLEAVKAALGTTELNAALPRRS
jgi:hypothetical protein